MPQITLDGVQINTETGKTIIQAAYENGMEITHFCWHPELSVSGNCRMCLVEVGMPRRMPDGTFQLDSEGNPAINFMPKLQIACATEIQDGMVVRSKSENATKAQESVMEFILINHPLDCPICDEAGQCKLQEYAFNNSRGESRFIENKNPAPKRVSWGPHVMFDAERCITCSRCIRFSKEVAEQDVLTFVNRGDHVTINVAKGRELDNDYSMNVIDICPVGALTSKDFRFKSRVWDMSFNDSICVGCARGCNTKLGVRNNEILRIEPRANLNVNKYWMCDHGRLSQYSKVNENRILEPLFRHNNALQKSTWDEVYSFTLDKLKKFKPTEIMFIASAKATVEDNYLLMKFAKSIIKSNNLVFLKHNDESFADNKLKLSDQTPNSTGVTELLKTFPFPGIDAGQLAEKITSGAIKALYVMDEDFEGYSDILSSLSKLDCIIVHAQNSNALTELASAVLPSATFAELEGTYVNFEGRVQHITSALVTAENMRTMGMRMSRLDKFGAANDRWTQHETRMARQSWRIIKDLANIMNAGWKYKTSEDVFNDICTAIPSFAGMTYALLDEFSGIILNRASNPGQVLPVYESHFMKPN